MNPYGLLELSEPVTFEPVGPVTSVFYDAKNKQVGIRFILELINGQVLRIKKNLMIYNNKD